MPIDFLSEPWAVLLVRIVTLVAAASACFWSIKSAITRKQLELGDLADWILVFVSSYWTIYSLWVVIMYDGHNQPPLASYIFNMRFGLLITLAAFASLVKDRMLVSDLFKKLNNKQNQGDEEDKVL